MPSESEKRLWDVLEPFVKYIRARHAVFGKCSRHSYPHMAIDAFVPGRGPETGRIQAHLYAGDWDNLIEAAKEYESRQTEAPHRD